MNDEIREVKGQTRTDVLLLLAAADGAVVRADSILAALWGDDPPSSGRNAVQRHVSGLRVELRDLGVTDAASVIERVGDGYRLVDVSSDRSATGADSSWWKEPIQQASWDPHHVLRSQLVKAATKRALIEIRAVDRDDVTIERLGHLISHSPDGEILHRSLRTASVGLPVEAQPLQRSDAPSKPRVRLSDLDATFISRIGGIWKQHGSAAALDALDESGAGFDAISADLRHRLYRWLVWLPVEPWVEHALTMVPVGVRGGASERMLVSVDARALMQMSDGRKIAEAEIESAEDGYALERALRVRYLLGLAQPHDDRQDAIVRELGSLDLSDAQVEASRFRFLSAVRMGRAETWSERLDELEAVTAEQWPEGSDDFAPLARWILARSHDANVRRVFDLSPKIMTRYRSDPFATLVADACAKTLGGPSERPASEPEFWSAVGTMSESAGQAMRLLRGLRRGESVEAVAHGLALRLPETTREKHFLLLPVALAIVAEATGNRSIATRAFEALAPWSGQMLGLWPIDFVIGAADHWLDRLTAV